MGTNEDAKPGAAVARKGRGSGSRPAARYLVTRRSASRDAESPGADLEPVRTTVTWERARSLITRNCSPDLPFAQTVNPYRGCEHGCAYCYARPTHAYLDLSPGLDFETRLIAKADAARVLARELAAPGYRCSPIVLGANTDAYQPIERELRVTREVLEVLASARHPVSIITKSALVERDIDLLRELARVGAAQVFLSITTLDAALARRLEPRAVAPRRRIATLRALADAGIRGGVMIAPIIPGLNDSELEAILVAAAAAGARHAGYGMLRLPREVSPLFREWLAAHYPLKAARVLSLLRGMRDGALSDSRFGTRMTGTGVYAQLIRDRFVNASKRHGLTRSDQTLSCASFTPPTVPGTQLRLW